MTQKKVSRRGITLMLVVVCMAILAIMMTSAVRNALVQRQFHERRAYQAQAYWLAQAGIEQAAARLLAEPATYNGETLPLIPRSEVRITVERRKDAPDLIRITSEASYPKDEVTPASAVASRSFRLKQDNGRNVLVSEAASANSGRPESKLADEKKMEE